MRVVALILLIAAPAAAQQALPSRGAVTPLALVAGVTEAFAHGDPVAFDAWFPFEDGREVVRFAAAGAHTRLAQQAVVLSEADSTAVLLLGGVVLYGNSGDETLRARTVTGLYRAARARDGLWRLAGRLPLEGLGRPLAHRLSVRLDPGQGLAVTDTLVTSVLGPDGVAFRLNHTARLVAVERTGRPAEHRFGGGLLWVRAAHADADTLVLRYTLDVARDSAASANSGRFLPDFGHVRNQYVWHPLVWFDDAAAVSLAVDAPAGVVVATDLPQRETVAGGRRTVRAASATPVAALSLFYDRAWVPVRRQVRGYTLAVFATPDFEPAPDTLARAFERVVDLLSARFGPPSGQYVAVVQQRARSGASWPFMSNAAIAANTRGGALATASPRARAFFGHEVAHAWTRPTGPARNFLSEGWATFAESLLLRDAFGSATEALFWESQRTTYAVRGFDGTVSLADDPRNDGVSYAKGAWVLRMLADAIGPEAFDAGFRAYAGTSSGYDDFAAAMSTAAGRDVRPFLDPWVLGTHVPDLEARVEGDSVVVDQLQIGRAFVLTVDVDVVAGADTLRARVALDGASGRAHVPGLAGLSVTAVNVDPDHRLLIQRYRGEVVRFELDAPADAQVALEGDFSAAPVPATYADGRWRVDLPLTAGTYRVGWRRCARRDERPEGPAASASRGRGLSALSPRSYGAGAGDA